MLVGVICGRDGQYRPFEECIACHEKGAGSCHAPTILLKMMRDNHLHRKDAAFSATTLIKCARAFALEQTHDYYEDLESGWNKVRGELIHAFFEKDVVEPHIIRERRVKKIVTIEGQDFVVTGKPDYVDPVQGSLIDYKFTGEIPEKDKDDHIAQFNIYAWLLRGGVFLPQYNDWGEKIADEEPANIDVTRGGMYYVTLKKKKKRDGTIIKPWKKTGYPIWPAEQTEAFIADRLRPIALWKQTGILPDCNAYIRFPGKWRCECERLQEQIEQRGETIASI